MATTTATRRLAAILAADVAGYSRLMGADEEGTHERLRAHHRELIDPKISEHHGRVVKTTGDGVLAEFASVVDAVRCASDIQRAMIDREAGIPDDRLIRFRIGINLGDVIVEDEDIFGDGVNVAARLEASAEPGGICVSGVVADQIRNKLPYLLRDRGEQSFKNIARPVRVYALRPDSITGSPAPGRPSAAPLRSRSSLALIAAAAVAVLLIASGGAWWLWPATKPSSTPAVAATTSIAQPLAAPGLSIVVLPFANLSSDPEQQYFADGITEDVTTDLSRIAHSLVISRNTAFTYRNKSVDTKQIGRELGVRYVLEGSVRRSGNKVRVNAQLIDAETDAHLWADQFDGDTGDLFALQNEITSRIAIALNLELAGRDATRPTEHPDALDFILRGRAAYWDWKGPPPTRDRLAETTSLFERALALDPRSVDAETWVALMLSFRVGNGSSEAPAADLQRADELVGRALEASPRDWFAHFVKGRLLLQIQGRCEDAIPEFETALALNRNWLHSLNELALCKIMAGLIEDATPLVEQAIRLSPRDPFIRSFYTNMGIARLLQSHTDEAILWFEKARGMASGWPYSFLAAIYGLRGETDKAAANLAEARRLFPNNYSSIARRKAQGLYSISGYWGVPKVQALFEATYFAGLGKAGVPEE
jgi:TolB-like protein/class 3 adenylate cyclase/Flp pilus assembly protein TadD